MMNIVHASIKVRDLVKGYQDDVQTGHISGYNGKLDIRPAYQREFIYKDKQRDAVIETINKGFPLNVIYWAKKEDGTFEILDGQQRTISICQYCNDEFSLDYRYFHNLTEDEKNVILDYELDVYQCEGSDKEKLDWFKIINIAGEKLTDQELRNAVYAGTWLSDAKKGSLLATAQQKDWQKIIWQVLVSGKTILKPVLLGLLRKKVPRLKIIWHSISMMIMQVLYGHIFHLSFNG